MSVRIIDSRDTNAQTSSDGATIVTREIQYEGDSFMDIVSSNLYPKRGSRHPENSIYYLNDIQLQSNGNVGNGKRGCSALATLSYSNGKALKDEFKGNPWDIGAQNYKSNIVPINVPLISGWDDNGKKIQLVNTAGCRIEAETGKGVKEISFIYAIKAKSGNFDGNLDPIINRSSVKVAGDNIPAKCGLLQPLSAEYVPEYDGTGKLTREYWNVIATIQIKADGWKDEFLNVGTMARFKVNNVINNNPQPIFQYTPWRSTNESQKIATAPQYGSMAQVIAAKNYYANLETDETKKQQMWNELPYSEVTDPFPLTETGEIFTDALINPVSNPYKKISMYKYVIGSWNAYNLPKERA